MKELVLEQRTLYCAVHLNCVDKKTLAVKDREFFVDPVMVKQKEDGGYRYIGICPLCGENIVADVVKAVDVETRKYELLRYLREHFDNIAYIKLQTLSVNGKDIKQTLIVLDEALCNNDAFMHKPRTSYIIKKRSPKTLPEIALRMNNSLFSTDYPQIFIYK